MLQRRRDAKIKKKRKEGRKALSREREETHRRGRKGSAPGKGPQKQRVAGLEVGRGHQWLALRRCTWPELPQRMEAFVSMRSYGLHSVFAIIALMMLIARMEQGCHGVIHSIVLTVFYLLFSFLSY